MICKALTLNSRRPCRAHASRSGSGFCSFHELDRKEPDPWNTPEGQRAAYFVQCFNLFDRALRESRPPGEDDSQIIITQELLWIAEHYLGAWMPCDEFTTLSVRAGFPVPPDGTGEYMGHLRDAALEIVTSDPRLGATN